MCDNTYVSYFTKGNVVLVVGHNRYTKYKKPDTHERQHTVNTLYTHVRVRLQGFFILSIYSLWR
jgi:single-stranded DNA-binding protein